MDMKRYYILLHVLLGLSVFVMSSCTKGDKVIAEGDGESAISLTVVCKEHSTKATRPGEERYNENRIRSIEYYFYPLGGTASDAVIHKRVLVDVEAQYTISINLNEAMLNNVLFPGGNDQCVVAVVVNYPTEIGNTNLNTLKSKPLSTDFKGSPIQQSFVMFGTGEVTLISRKQTIVAAPTVTLNRVASKVTLSAHVAPSVQITNKIIYGGVEHDRIETWVPNLEGMKLYLVNGEKNAVVDGDPTKVTTHELFKYSERDFTTETETHAITRQVLQGTTWTTITSTEEFIKSYPYYTYPETWANNDPKEPYLKLVLPWTRLAGSDAYGTWGGTNKPFYYHIVLPNNATGFESNNWYKIFLEVAILGSDTDEAEVDIEGSYYVVPWNSEAVEKDVDILSTRYLSVGFKSYTMYNTNLLKIPYVTSNKCEIADLYVKQYNFKTDSYDDKTAAASAGNWVTLDNNNNIVINHTVDNVLSSDTFDCSPYEYSFKIWHVDLHSYVEEIKIIQYPAMYIIQHHSDGIAYVKGTGNSTDSDYIYDNNSSLQGRYRRMGTMSARSAIVGHLDDNTNQNQYTIHITVLPEGSTYSIGDPRTTTPDNLNSGITELDNYRPADTDPNIMAPVFRIASSYGRTNMMTYEGAQKRCATYQENGYPAGRWRLPTKAEIEYIMTLSNKGLIPKLFDPEPTAGYWASGKLFMIRYNSGDLDFKDAGSATPTESYSYYSGTYTYNYNIGGTNYNVWARCVYDEWFWGDDRVTEEGEDEWAGYHD